MANQYRLKIVQGDREFEAEGDKAFVLKMADRFDGTLGTGSPAEAKQPRKTSSHGPAGKTDRTGKELSAREFIQKLGLKKHTDLVLAFGYYIEHNLAKTSFTPADVNNLYYEAKLEASNTSQAIIQNIRRSMMMEVKAGASEKGGRKSYTLTQSGEDFIAGKFDKPAAP